MQANFTIQVDLDIGEVNNQGLRGTKALRDMKKNQIAVHLPNQLVVELGESHLSSAVCAELTTFFYSA
jgi:cell division septal protein FtsQ